jgi:hypothetical protein
MILQIGLVLATCSATLSEDWHLKPIEVEKIKIEVPPESGNVNEQTGMFGLFGINCLNYREYPSSEDPFPPDLTGIYTSLHVCCMAAAEVSGGVIPVSQYIVYERWSFDPQKQLIRVDAVILYDTDGDKTPDQGTYTSLYRTYDGASGSYAQEHCTREELADFGKACADILSWRAKNSRLGKKT